MIGWETGFASDAIGFLLDWSLRWGAVLAVLWLWLAIQPPGRADLRHALCIAALFAGLLVPLSPRWSLATVPVESTPISRETTSPRNSAAVEVIPPVAKGGSPPASPRTQRHPASNPSEPTSTIPHVSIPGIVLCAWLAGAVAAAARLAIGWRILMRLRSEGTPLPSALLDDCRKILGVGRPVGLASHAAIGSPVTLGGRRPTILLPKSWGDWAEADRRAALLHELSHIARRDDWMKFLQELIRIPLFFHPLVRWLLVRLDREREWLCDEAVVALGSDRVAYARLLLEQAQRPGRVLRPGLPFLERRTVAARIERLLEDPMLATSPPASRRRLALLGAAFLIATTALSTARVRPAAAQSPPAPSAPQKAAIPTRTVPGVVRDAEGNPVAGAMVVAGVRGEKNLQSQVMTTDEHGQFTCKIPLHESMLSVIVHKPGCVPMSWFDVYKAQDPLKEIVFRVGKVKPGQFAAELKDGQGRPLVGASVWVDRTMTAWRQDVPGSAPGQSFISSFWHDYPNSIIRGSPMEPFFHTSTDKDGRFEFSSFPDGYGLKLTVVGADGRHYRVRDRNAPRPGLQIPTPSPLPPPGETPPAQAFPQHSDPIDVLMAGGGFVRSAGEGPVELIARPAARIEGRLISRIPDLTLDSLRVTFQQSRRADNLNVNTNTWGETVATADGSFSFDDMDEGTVNVLVGRARSGGPREWTYRAAQDVRLVSGETSRVEIEILRGVEVEGVVLSPDGIPVANVNLGSHGPAHPRSGAAVGGSKTDETGRFRFRLPPGENYIYVMGYAIGKADLTVDVPDGPERFEAPDLVIKGQPLNLKEYPIGDFHLQPPKPKSR